MHFPRHRYKSDLNQSSIPLQIKRIVFIFVEFRSSICMLCAYLNTYLDFHTISAQKLEKTQRRLLILQGCFHQTVSTAFQKVFSEVRQLGRHLKFRLIECVNFFVCIDIWKVLLSSMNLLSMQGAYNSLNSFVVDDPNLIAAMTWCSFLRNPLNRLLGLFYQHRLLLLPDKYELVTVIRQRCNNESSP